MLTYIVEDSALKASLLKEFLNTEFPVLEISIQGSYQSGMKAVEKNPPQLILLDMTLPTFDRQPNAREGRLRPQGGYDMLRKIKLRAIKTSVVVVTQLEAFGEGDEQVSFSEMTLRCNREFPEIFLGSVYFDQRESAWQGLLAEIIKEKYFS